MMGSTPFSQSSSLQSEKDVSNNQLRKQLIENPKTVTLNLGEDLIIKRVDKAG
jgi:hypothetical protein